MIEEIKLDSLAKLFDFIVQNPIGKHPIMNFTYRGQNKADYKLSSCLRRSFCSEYEHNEKRLLINFQKYGQSIEPHLCDSVWHNMIIAQHHGIPTRLLDFSVSPLVALHFALTDINSNDDAALWAISHVKLHNILPIRYKKLLKENMGRSFTAEMLEELKISIFEYNRDMGNSSLLFLEPPSIDARIVNQFSHFALIPDMLDPLDDYLMQLSIPHIAYKFIIPSKNKRVFRQQLDTVNITERTLFPGLDGIASYLSRRYRESF